MSCWIVVNPKAGSGRAAAASERLAQLAPEAEVKHTKGPGDATSIARAAAEAGIGVVVAVGGDGTIHECVAGLVLGEDGSPRSASTKLALCPSGTGGDFRKTFGIENAVEQAASRIFEPNPRRIDVGRATFESPQGRKTTAFANVLSFGLGGLTDQLVARSPKWIGGRAAFFLGAVRANLIHQPLPLELRLDGEVLETAPFSNVAVCNGQFFGGGMKIAPDADPSDGLFDVVTMELSKLETMTLAAAIYRGTHLERERVQHYRCKKLEVRPTRPGASLLDVDGEQLGQLPLEVELLPKALELLV